MKRVLKSLDTFKAAGKGKVFGVSYEASEISDRLSAVFFANVEDNDSEFDLSGNANKFCFYDLNQHVVIHNLYDSKDVIFHGLAARRHKYPYADEFDYQHIYKGITDNAGNRLSNDIKSIVQAQDTFYAIDGMSQYGHYCVNDELYDWLARNNGYAFPAATSVKTLLYDPNSISSDTGISVLSVIEGVKYSTLHEIPGNIQQDYSLGTMLGTTVKTKSQYDSTYSMHHESGKVLSNSREYYEVCNNNDQVYLKYRDNVSYGQDTFAGKNHVIVGEPQRNEITYKLPHIEVLKNINRGASGSQHKSSLYSIDIKTKALKAVSDSTAFSQIQKDKILANLKNEIKNCVRQIASKIAPANTQLFAVTVH